MTPLARDGLTEAQVRTLLTGEGVRRGYGCDVRDPDTGVWSDASEWVHTAWEVSHDNTAEVHGSLSIALTRAWPWGRTWFRPWMTLARDDIGTARFEAGVYLLSTPTRTHGRDPAVYQCSGRDLLTLATRQVGDTFVAATGSTYLSLLRTIFTDHLGMAAPLLDGDAQGTTLPADRVWALSANPRWLDIANDLMAEIGYTDVYMSPDGTPRARPVAATDTRPVEWHFDAGVPLEDLIAADYTETVDLWAAPNQWRFVRTGLDYQPTEGDGIYSPDNKTDGPACIDSVGLNPAPTQWLDVADQAALVAEGDRIVAADRRAEAAYELDVDPLPVAWHRDVVQLTGSDGASVKTQVTGWTLTPYGKGRWTLGGGPGGVPASPVNVAATGTVTQASPLRVVCDGASVDSAAVALADDSGVVPSYSIGSRVSLVVRNPQIPQVQGVETTL